jgi:hypothetical protein
MAWKMNQTWFGSAKMILKNRASTGALVDTIGPRKRKS